MRIYLRIGKNGYKYKVVAATKSNPEALHNGSTYRRVSFPTVEVALDLDIPDSEFDKTRILLDAKIEETQPCVEVKQVLPEEVEEEE